MKKELLALHLVFAIQMACAESISLPELTQILKQTSHTEKGSLIVPGAKEKYSTYNYLKKEWDKLIQNKKSLLRDDKQLKKFRDIVVDLFDNPILRLNTSLKKYIQQAIEKQQKTIAIIGTSDDHTLKSLSITPDEDSLRQAVGAIVSAYFEVNHINKRLKEGKRELFSDQLTIELK